MGARKQCRGNALLEFTLVGIPLIFILISTFELARGMWNYHTMSFAVKEGARLAALKGKGCSQPGNNCGITVAGIAKYIAKAGVGLDASALNVTLASASGSVQCNPLSNCYTNATAWPPTGQNARGMTVTVTGQYAFRSAMAIFWPGAAKVSFNALNLPASSRQGIQF